MLKILHLYKTYYPDSYGGIEQVIFQLSEGAFASGISSTVLALSPNGSSDSKPFYRHHVAYSAISWQFASTPFSYKAIGHFKALAAGADIIHYHFPFPFMDIMHFVAGIKKPTVVTYHSDIVKQKAMLQLYRPLMNRFLTSVDRIVASSPNYVDSSPVLQRFLPKISVIPFGLDPASYPPARDELLEAWRSRIGGPFFLFIGAFRYYKGLQTLLVAAKISGYPVVLVGVGPMEGELKQQAAQLGLRNIHFLGALPDKDKIALLTLCYGIVFPSHLRSEAFGITLLEGAMFAKPMITCEIGTGTTFVNIHHETGLAVRPTDPEELADAMRQLWHNPVLARRYGDNARERFDAMFTSAKMVESYISLYRSLL
ncbi:glycosyltransferase family 4 protein [Sodalis sp. RH23]|uniref:glycosyltransferase family 4 protein n=1 Tax=unclassified Sodalis (in: enterobacteria) TaxID=2636512 RepID=UPI0039B3A283